MGKRISEEDAWEVMLNADLLPIVIYPGSSVRWPSIHIPCGRVTAPHLDTIKAGGTGCRHCAGQAIDEPEAVAVMLAAGYRPIGPYTKANQKWPSIHIICGREVAPVYNTIQQGGGGCKHCAKGVYVDPDHAAAVMRAAGLEPLTTYPGATVSWPCICSGCGGKVAPRYNTIRQGGGGCTPCGIKRRAATRKNKLRDAAIATMHAAGLEPQVPYPGANNPWLCKCTTCKKEVSPSYSSVQRGHGCKYCANSVVDPEDAATVMIAAGYRPLTPYPGKNDRSWLCVHELCGQEVSPIYNRIKGGGGGCSSCGLAKRTKSAVDNKAESAVATMLAAGLRPLTPYPGSKKPWSCIHEPCGHEVTPAHSNVKQGRGICKHCAGACPRTCHCRAEEAA